MTMTLAYAIALAEARSCLAALADTATDFDESVLYEHLLLDLDALHPDGPGLTLMSGSKAELLDLLEAAVVQMLDLGGDGLVLELLLASALQPIWGIDRRGKERSVPWRGGNLRFGEAT